MWQQAAYLPVEYNVVPDSSRALSLALLDSGAKKKKTRKMHYIQYKAWLTKLYCKYSKDHKGYQA